MKLPYGELADRAQILQKLETYALDTTHSSGKHKTRLFSAKLGITLDNRNILVDALLNAAIASEAVPTTPDRYGDAMSLTLNSAQRLDDR